MRRRLVFATVVLLAAAVPVACGDDLSSESTLTSQPTATTASTTTATTTTVISPPSPSVPWRETLALGSQTAVRHIAVGNERFLVLSEADYPVPGQPLLSGYVSADGASWSRADLPAELFADVMLFEVSGGPVGFIGTGSAIYEQGDSGADYAWISANGEDWTRSQIPTAIGGSVTSPFVVEVSEPSAPAVGEDGFVVAGITRRYLDTDAIIATNAPQFEWPEFFGMETRTLEDGDVQLTLAGGDGDFVATFSELGIEPDDFPSGDIGSDWISLTMGLRIWTSPDGVEWEEQRAPELGGVLVGDLELTIDATTHGWYVHGLHGWTGDRYGWRSTDGSEWTPVDLPGGPVHEWRGGLFVVDANRHLWLSADGVAWHRAEAPEVVTNSRDVRPIAATPTGAIALVGMKPDAEWQSGTVPESWVAVTGDGTTWWQASDVEAFAMPIWPEAVASNGNAVVLGLVGEPPTTSPQTYVWLGTTSGW